MNTYGTKFRLSIFGESHGILIGVVLDGVPAGISLSEADFLPDLARRKSGAKGTTPRKEDDLPEIVSGICDGCTTGAPLTIVFRNNNTRSGDYSTFREIPRPGHADFVSSVKYNFFNDIRGGGHFSGRITLCLVAAGVVAKKLIGPIRIEARIAELGGIPAPIACVNPGGSQVAGQTGQTGQPGESGQYGQIGQPGQTEQTGESGQSGQTVQIRAFGQTGLTNQTGKVGETDLDVNQVTDTIQQSSSVSNPISLHDAASAQEQDNGKITGYDKWDALLDEVIKTGDSIGGIIECTCTHVPVGMGEPFFDSLESQLAHLAFSIPATRGIEFGDGFSAATMRGSQHNDCYIDKEGHTSTNGAGGINGGISNGNPIVFRVAIKPTASISQTQSSFNFITEQMEAFSVKGRHDACIALRCPVIVEAIAAIAFANN